LSTEPYNKSMAAAESTMLPLGTEAPEFALPEVSSGKTIALRDFDRKGALLVIFLCRHCPFVKHVQNGLAALGRDYARQEIGIVGISSNDAKAYPGDRPASLKEQAEEAGFTFPYLYDESQEVARAYHAACTPDFFLFDRARRLVYRGQFDSSRPSNGIAVTGEDLRRAIDTVLQGKPVPAEQRASVGCSIKWKSYPAKAL
jgi:peroxiredoxin